MNRPEPQRPHPLADDLSLPPGIPEETQALIRMQYQLALAAREQAAALREFEERMSTLETLFRPVAEAEAQRLAARARLATAFSTGIEHFINCTRGVAESFASLVSGIFNSTVTRVVGAVGLVLAVLSLAGVQMTVFDANRALETLSGALGGQCSTSTPETPQDP